MPLNLQMIGVDLLPVLDGFDLAMGQVNVTNNLPLLLLRFCND